MERVKMPTFKSVLRMAACGCLVMVRTLQAAPGPAGAEVTHQGYYRSPAVHDDTIVFTSEGDLWTVGLGGGGARRLTTAPGTETMATLSPDGQTVAFLANYEGPAEVYTMPVTGGLPRRRTWEGDVTPAGWTADGRLMISSRRYSTLPGEKLVLIDAQGKRDIVQLAEAAQGAWSADGQTLFFTRWNKQSSSTRRYKGGWAENIWRFDGRSEAVPLTADYAGTSAHPMVANGRIYFLSDRSGVMNVWSMNPDGGGLRQESHQRRFDIESASLSGSHVVYACAADLWLLDLTSGREQVIPITLQSDFDQLREHWISKPGDYLTAVHIAPDGASAVFTARGEVFSLPVQNGRAVRVAADSGVRFRDARFTPDGKSVVALSTRTGETEFWRFPANGVGAPEQWTRDAHVLRTDGVLSPDGKWLAHANRDQELWLLDVKSGADRRMAHSMNGGFSNLSWSPDSRWLAYSESADNEFQQIKILDLAGGRIEAITSDRFNSSDPIWSSDGKWLYFLSDRALTTAVPSPWGPREPEPHYEHTVKVYQLALVPGLRSAFLPADELHPEAPAPPGDKDAKPAKARSAGPTKPEVRIDFGGLGERLTEVPVPAGNYADLQATGKRLCWGSAADYRGEHVSLQCLDIANKGAPVETLMSDVKGFEISAGRNKMLVRTLNKQPGTNNGADNFYIFDADVTPASAADPKVQAKAAINLSRWQFSVNPREEFRSLFLDAWLMERDYFYDRHMHGVDWPAMRDRYLPLVDRVADRDELNDVIEQMVGELSALHTFVRGGDIRTSADHVGLATLGAVLRRDQARGGYLVDHVYAHDPDLPEQAPPLARPDSIVREGEVITSIDGIDALSVPDEGVLLRNKAGLQVLLHVQGPDGAGRDVLVQPINAGEDALMRYSEWEYTRRLAVDQASGGAIGYVHLRAMGSADIDQWMRDYYPVFKRQGLIIDVRHNRGGNIDSWLLGRLLRQAWFYWQPRTGNPSWNMQYAFRGHIVVLCDHATASDGEAFSEGFKRLGLGKLIGTRTWGGEIWLSMDNTQADNGIASAAETGVYAGNQWLIEGHGVDPDQVVDNLPHASYSGADAQLDAAIRELEQEIRNDPRPVPPAPPYPDKSFKYQQ